MPKIIKKYLHVYIFNWNAMHIKSVLTFCEKKKRNNMKNEVTGIRNARKNSMLI
jgi:hypothetical protein